MITKRQSQSLIKAIEKFNADFAAYTKASGDSDLPSIDGTIIGYDPAQPYTYRIAPALIVRKVTDADGIEYKVTNEKELDVVKETLKYDRRRLAKAWRVFKSYNPDWELEHDTEEDEE